MQRFRHDRHTDPIELMPIPNTTMRNPSFDTPVLIVGGGPVGFALALDLAVRGNRSIGHGEFQLGLALHIGIRRKVVQDLRAHLLRHGDWNARLAP